MQIMSECVILQNPATPEPPPNIVSLLLKQVYYKYNLYILIKSVFLMEPQADYYVLKSIPLYLLGDRLQYK